MADNDSSEKVKKTDESKNNNKTPGLSKHAKEWLLVTGVVAALMLAYGIGYSCANHHNEHNKFFAQGFMARGGDEGGPVTITSGSATAVGGGMMMGRGEIGASTMMDNDTHHSGVVTAVSGANFTIAGNGASTSVTTSSSTEYQGGNTVKANDSVIVEGTKTGDTIAATRVIINP
jgi:hypothetical protein